jgi:hypothetical protein
MNLLGVEKDGTIHNSAPHKLADNGIVPCTVSEYLRVIEKRKQKPLLSVLKQFTYSIILTSAFWKNERKQDDTDYVFGKIKQTLRNMKEQNETNSPVSYVSSKWTRAIDNTDLTYHYRQYDKVTLLALFYVTEGSELMYPKGRTFKFRDPGAPKVDYVKHKQSGMWIPSVSSRGRHFKTKLGYYFLDFVCNYICGSTSLKMETKNAICVLAFMSNLYSTAHMHSHDTLSFVKWLPHIISCNFENPVYDQQTFCNVVSVVSSVLSLEPETVALVYTYIWGPLKTSSSGEFTLEERKETVRSVFEYTNSAHELWAEEWCKIVTLPHMDLQLIGSAYAVQARTGNRPPCGGCRDIAVLSLSKLKQIAYAGIPPILTSISTYRTHHFSQTTVYYDVRPVFNVRPDPLQLHAKGEPWYEFMGWVATCSLEIHSPVTNPKRYTFNIVHHKDQVELDQYRKHFRQMQLLADDLGVDAPHEPEPRNSYKCQNYRWRHAIYVVTADLRPLLPWVDHDICEHPEKYVNIEHYLHGFADSTTREFPIVSYDSVEIGQPPSVLEFHRKCP